MYETGNLLNCPIVFVTFCNYLLSWSFFAQECFLFKRYSPWVGQQDHPGWVHTWARFGTPHGAPHLVPTGWHRQDPLYCVTTSGEQQLPGHRSEPDRSLVATDSTDFRRQNLVCLTHRSSELHGNYRQQSAVSSVKITFCWVMWDKWVPNERSCHHHIPMVATVGEDDCL